MEKNSQPSLVVNFCSVCLTLLAIWFPLPLPLIKFVAIGVVAAILLKSESPMVKSAAKCALWVWSFFVVAGLLMLIYLRIGRFG